MNELNETKDIGKEDIQYRPSERKDDKYTKIKGSLVFKNGDSFESLVGQLQKETTKILCVIDGCNIRSYKAQQTSIDRVVTKVDNLPKDLIFEHKQKISKYKIMIYYYRCSSTDRLYAFFLDSIHNQLKLEEENGCIGKVVKVNKNTKTEII